MTCFEHQWPSWMACALAMVGCEPAPEIVTGGSSDRPELASEDLKEDPGGSRQLPGFDVTISIEGDDVVLSWSDQGAGSTYSVWRSSDPYFEIAGPSATMLTLDAGATSYIDAGANDEESYYYRIMAQGPGSEQASTVVGKQAQPLVPGYNKIAQCLINDIDLSSELAAEVGHGVISVHIWDEVTQGWAWWWVVDDDLYGDLSFSTGDVVAVDMPAETSGTYAVVGAVPAEGDVSMSLLPGDNAVTTLPPRFGDVMASELLALVPHATRVGWWDANEQSTRWYPDGSDFQIEHCGHVHLEVTEESMWPPPWPTGCAEVLAVDPTAASGIHTIDPDGPGGVAPYDAYCEMDRDDGGWTLAMISADDGQATWTWNTRSLMTTDTTTVGDLGDLMSDFKSPVVHELPFTDLMFVHEPSGIWAAYHQVGSGTQDVGSFMASQPSPYCNRAGGHPMDAGTLTPTGGLCNTNLFFHMGDWDGPAGSSSGCANPATTYASNNSYGPGWSHDVNNGCGFDDPVHSGFGPAGSWCSSCSSAGRNAEVGGRGFGYALGLNEPGARISMYLR